MTEATRADLVEFDVCILSRLRKEASQSSINGLPLERPSAGLPFEYSTKTKLCLTVLSKATKGFRLLAMLFVWSTEARLGFQLANRLGT